MVLSRTKREKVRARDCSRPQIVKICVQMILSRTNRENVRAESSISHKSRECAYKRLLPPINRKNLRVDDSIPHKPRKSTRRWSYPPPDVVLKTRGCLCRVWDGNFWRNVLSRNFKEKTFARKWIKWYRMDNLKWIFEKDTFEVYLFYRKENIRWEFSKIILHWPLSRCWWQINRCLALTSARMETRFI